MIRPLTTGVMHAVGAKAKLPVKSSTTMKHLFASYFSDDPFEWRLFRNVLYIVIPTREYRNIVSLTIYIQHTHNLRTTELRTIARMILRDALFPKECGVTIVSIGTPKLFLRPQVSDGRADERTAGRSQKLLQ